ncbi:MAG: carboxypeptidase-like regulatory domain-containing protein [Gemmatimonadota bacterium]|nr:carboxypeptidase-like regulatory domain-containing protein [Gemmatimonadota bacterium]
MRVLTAHLSLLCLIPAALSAQARSGTDILTGRVTDLTGRPVSDAQILATSLGTGLTRSRTTDADGHYKIYFPETAARYTLSVKRMGFSPVQRAITRRTAEPEEMTIDIRFGGTPLALSSVEIEGSSNAPRSSRPDQTPRVDATVPNPVSEILALRDTLHLSAVQIVALTDVADSLQEQNGRIYKNIRTLLGKSEEAGDVSQMAGSVAMMLEEASGNTTRAVTEAEKLLRPGQWVILPAEIRDRIEKSSSTQPSSKQ